LTALAIETPAAAPAEPRTGGEVRFLAAGDIDPPQDPVTPVPDLASGPPEVAADGRSIVVHRDDAAGLSSADVAGVVNAYTTTWDLSFSGLR
jgi:hypothetical protein